MSDDLRLALRDAETEARFVYRDQTARVEKVTDTVFCLYFKVGTVWGISQDGDGHPVRYPSKLAALNYLAGRRR